MAKKKKAREVVVRVYYAFETDRSPAEIRRMLKDDIRGGSRSALTGAAREALGDKDVTAYTAVVSSPSWSVNAVRHALGILADEESYNTGQGEDATV
jgi:hypothetical protein